MNYGTFRLSGTTLNCGIRRPWELAASPATCFRLLTVINETLTGPPRQRVHSTSQAHLPALRGCLKCLKKIHACCRNRACGASRRQWLRSLNRPVRTRTPRWRGDGHRKRWSLPDYPIVVVIYVLVMASSSSRRILINRSRSLFSARDWSSSIRRSISCLRRVDALARSSKCDRYLAVTYSRSSSHATSSRLGGIAIL